MKKHLLIATSFGLLALAPQAQEIMPGYIQWPSGESLPTYLRQWNGGAGKIQIDGKDWEDVNFFTSRVRPKARFYNTATQVYPGITQYNAETNPNGTDKRLVYWVPVGDEKRNGANTNALPNGLMDQEVFSMWSYLDHYGDWSSPFGWVPGAFADVAHKNGVAVSGVAGVPWQTMTTNWQNCFTQFYNGGNGIGEDLGKFLYYHGTDGLGYNSEWSGFSPRTYITPTHDGIAAFMADKNPLYENMWYGGTNDYGSITFDTGVHSSYANIFRNASIFLNYNWNRPATMENSVAYAKSVGRNPFFIYAGHNMQGADPGTSNFEALANYQYSIGLWGAHNCNMIWKDRNARGSSTQAMQRTYTNDIERFFGNGPRNPAIKLELKANRTHRPADDWAGFSSLMSARSTLNWTLEDEPFITYFNLGNGTFFNWMGERVSNNQWYNIGLQDYLPTWRFWFAPTFLQTDVEPETVHLSADFTWDEAYFGGSSLQISGTSDNEYLHLFKTDFNIKSGSTITVSYKLLEGEADASLVVSTTADPKTIVGEDAMTILSAADAEEDIFTSYDGWVTKTIKPTAKILNSLKNGTAVIGIHFKNAKNLRLCLGQLAVTPRVTYVAPEKPEVTLTKVFVNNYNGIDGKIIWNMASTKSIGEPVYNIDVKTSMFRVWAQQEGCEPVFTGATTSWASLVFSAPYDAEASGRIRFGVSAVGLDNVAESEIAWGEYLDIPQYQGTDKIALDKLTIKPNEEFSLSFVDPLHGEATWTISNPETNETLMTATGKKVTCNGIAEVGTYNVTVNFDGKTVSYPRFIPVSPEETGALPRILDLSVEGGDAEFTVNEPKKFKYDGRKADGQVSRGLSLNEGWFGVNVGELGIEANTSFSVAAWIKYDELPEDRSNFITIEDRQTGGWPYNNWGYFWSRITGDGTFVHPNIDTAWGMRVGPGTEGLRIFYRYDDARIDVGAWTHVAIVFEHDGNKVRQKFYINGKQQRVGAWFYGYKSDFESVVGSESGDWTNIEEVLSRGKGQGGTNTYEPTAVATQRPISSSDWIAFGGTAPNITATKGCVDDFQVWGKAMTQEDVEASMNGLDGNNLPADVLGYWNFETEPGYEYDETTQKGRSPFAGLTGANAKKQSPRGYWYLMDAGNGEGSGKFNLSATPGFLSGCPFIPGDAYKVQTEPTWKARGALVSEAQGSDTEGSAQIAFRREGDYNVSLTLANTLGSDTKEYPVVTVGSALGAIDGVAEDAADIVTYTTSGTLFVEFAADGDYTVDVINLAGQTVAQKATSILAGQNVQISLPTAGVYLVKVTRDGKTLRTVKVINK